MEENFLKRLAPLWIRATTKLQREAANKGQHRKERLVHNILNKIIYY